MFIFNYQRRKRKGVSVLELVATLPFLIVILLISVDVAFFIYASDLCDRLCQECARAAGQMATPDDAVNAMNAVAEGAHLDGPVIEKLYPELLVYRDGNRSSNLPTPAYGTTSSYLAKNGPSNIRPEANSSEQGQTAYALPYVVVRTTVVLRLPFSVQLFLSDMFSSKSKQSSGLFTLHSTYSFPITNTFSPL